MAGRPVLEHDPRTTAATTDVAAATWAARREQDAIADRKPTSEEETELYRATRGNSRTTRPGNRRGLAQIRAMIEETTTGVHRPERLCTRRACLKYRRSLTTRSPSPVRTTLYGCRRVDRRSDQARDRRLIARQGRHWSAATATWARAVSSVARAVGAGVGHGSRQICALQAADGGYRVVTMDYAGRQGTTSS